MARREDSGTVSVHEHKSGSRCDGVRRTHIPDIVKGRRDVAEAIVFLSAGENYSRDPLFLGSGSSVP